ncbi:hypothetical protein WN944_026391 [Citrus x changshan-huyou]|uniref:Uncharacterized protein n=1 Tax=Citrus x changshan-huyou TaxID=2935761 RepID=A0AAP0LRX7_9ROSI
MAIVMAKCSWKMVGCWVSVRALTVRVLMGIWLLEYCCWKRIIRTSDFGSPVQSVSHHSPVHTSHCSLTLRSYISVTDSQHRSQPTEPSTNSNCQTDINKRHRTQRARAAEQKQNAKTSFIPSSVLNPLTSNDHAKTQLPPAR